MNRYTDNSPDFEAIQAAIDNDDIPGIDAMLRSMDLGELEALADQVRHRMRDQRPAQKLLRLFINNQIDLRKKEAN